MRVGGLGIIAVAFLALEMVGMYLIGQRIGGLETALWLILDVVLGIWVIRHAGAAFLPGLMHGLGQGHPPFAMLWATGRRFLAGVLLILPGALSDLIALVLLLWPSPPAPPAGRRPPGRGPDDVIEGEFRRED